MALQDSNPERRNLSVLSLSIIVFYLACGSFTEGTVRLQIVNINFAKPEVLSFFVWGILVWFTFRYWLVHQGNWKEDFYNELQQYTPKFFINKYLIKRFKLSGDFEGAHYPDRYWFMLDGNRGHRLSFQHISKNTNGSQKQDYIQVSGFADWLIISVCGFYKNKGSCIFYN